MPRLEAIERRVVACRKCPELRAYCAEVGRVKKRAFLGHDYWARPVPGWGDPNARAGHPFRHWRPLVPRKTYGGDDAF